MIGFSLRKNMVFEWLNVSYKIIKLEKNNRALLERHPDLVLSHVSSDVLLAEYSAGNIRGQNTLGNSLSGALTPLYGRPLDELPEKVWTQVKRRLHYLEKIISEVRPVFTDYYLMPLIKSAAAEIDDIKPPSPRAVRRWYKKYIRTKAPRSLIPRYDLRGSSLPKQPARVLQLIAEALEEAFKLSPQTLVMGIHDRVVKKINEENQNRIGDNKLKAPSERTLYRLLDRAEVYELAKFREGKAVADRRFRIIKKGIKVARILERVEIDHTPLDLFLIDERTWLPLGRPTLSVAIDCFSRFPVGYYLSFGGPSTAALMGVLRHAILPKNIDVTAIPELKVNHAWPCYGLPEVLVVDNGMEFHSGDFESVCFDLSIKIRHC